MTIETIHDRKKRLLHRCHYRGSRECDLILKRFIETQSVVLDQKFTPKDWDLFESFLKEQEPDLLEWLVYKNNIPDHYQRLIQRLTAQMWHDITLADMQCIAKTFTQDIIQYMDYGVICFHGDLGVGKSTFIRTIIQTLCKNETLPVPSPTFTLMQDYSFAPPCPAPHAPGHTKTLWHIDLYRLNSSEECLELGLLELMNTQICCIEWPERLGSFLTQSRIDVYIDINPHSETQKRLITIEDLR